MKLYELNNAAVEDELKKTASDIPNKTESPKGDEIETSGGIGPDGEPLEPGTADGDMAGGMGGANPLDSGGMGGGFGGGFGGPESNTPEGPMQEQPDPEEVEKQTKKVDDALYSQVKDLPFATDYNHSQTKTGPYDILQMDNTELSQTRNILRNKLNMIGQTDRYGLYDDPGVRYYTDMINYVEKVIAAKNHLAKSSNPSETKKNQ